MVANRKEDVSRRNITLHPDTYSKLDTLLLEMMQERKNPKMSRNEVVEALMEEHYEKRGKRS